MSIIVEEKEKIVENFGRSTNDSGYTEVQIALWTKKINHLQIHLSVHKKDNHSIIGLKSIVTKRRKLIKYLKRKSITRYRILLERLALRR